MTSRCILFLPRSLLKLRDYYLIGVARWEAETLYVNFVGATRQLGQCWPGDGGDAAVSYVVARLGEACPDEYVRYASELGTPVGVHVTPGEEVGIARLWLRGRAVSPGRHTTVVLYRPESLVSCDSSPGFVDFLHQTSIEASAFKTRMGPTCLWSCGQPTTEQQPADEAAVDLPKWQQLLLKSALIRETGNKVTAVRIILGELSVKRRLSRRGKGLVFSILGDWLLGLCALWFLTHPDLILDMGLVAIGKVVTLLKSLIWWLMGVPAGLKLNRPLNQALGHFFLYHIHLWRTYVYIILPAFKMAAHTLPYCGLLGLSMLLSALADLTTIATLHIFCFYGYAAKLHAYETRGLAALWRLFRGKKWNPLRRRVDSYSYNANHLLLGTFLLTTLGFLLPTVLMYYSVFALLRVMVLGLRGMLRLVARGASFGGVWIWKALATHQGAPHLSILSSRPHQPPILALSFSTSAGAGLATPIDSDPLLPQWGPLLHNLLWGNII